jgi:hypothetical protein
MYNNEITIRNTTFTGVSGIRSERRDITAAGKLQGVDFKNITHAGSGGALSVNCDGAFEIVECVFFLCVAYDGSKVVCDCIYIINN